jgi:DNA polymerase III delta prime subunit
MTLIENIISRVAINASKLHYIILDEVDNLTKLAQQSLKSALNTKHAIFILTTNHISELDRGLLDRCVLVEMNAAPANQYLDLARAIVAETDIELTDIDLLPTIQAANGSFRNLVHNVARLARRQKEKYDTHMDSICPR